MIGYWFNSQFVLMVTHICNSNRLPFPDVWMFGLCPLDCSAASPAYLNIMSYKEMTLCQRLLRFPLFVPAELALHFADTGFHNIKIYYAG